MKKIIYLLAGALTAIAISPQAMALPGYSRQTGMACNICHFQSYPALSEVGRVFKAGGYTMIGAQQKVEGTEGLSLPGTLNASVVTKIQYKKSNGPKVASKHTPNDGELLFPDELLLIVGGRVSENIGAQLELNLKGKEAEPVVENFKMPFIYDVSGVKTGVILFTTAGQGVAYGFELLNTGAVRGGRIMEARKSFSAQQYIGTASAAEGVAVVASNSLFFANISKWSPRSVGASKTTTTVTAPPGPATTTTSTYKTGTPSATYIRLGFTPKIGSWDAGIGVQSWRGSTTKPDLTDVDTKAYAVDAQAQGEVGSMQLGIYLTHANASGSKAGDAPNFFNANANAMKATTIAGQLGVAPGKATLLMAYRKGDNGKTTGNGDNSLMIGGTYLLVQNVQLQLNHEKFSGSAYNGIPADGNRLTTLMLFAAF